MDNSTVSEAHATTKKVVKVEMSHRHWWGELVYRLTFDDGSTVETSSPSQYAPVLTLKA